MKSLLPIAVFLLMISIGMSLRPSELLRHWRNRTPWAWLRLVVATFLVPPVIVLLMFRWMPLDFGEAVGLFMLGVSPGAPLTTRNAAKRGFDMQIAASYQVWGAFLMPIMIPVIVFASAKLYDKDVWIPPALLLKEIAEKQFLPLLVGLTLMHFVPVFSAKVKPAITVTGNVLLVVMIAAALWTMRAALAAITPWLVVATLVLAVTSILAITLLLRVDAETTKTLALCNANRHVGLALLLAGEYVRARHAIPAIACYALVAPVVMLVYTRIVHRRVVMVAAA